jgi:hypothetical protein
MQNSETEPFYKKIKRLSFKKAFRAAARAILNPCNHAERDDLRKNPGNDRKNGLPGPSGGGCRQTAFRSK